MPEAAASVLWSLLDCGLKECKFDVIFEASLRPNSVTHSMHYFDLDSSAEYLAQSGVMASLLKQQREETQGTGASVSRVRIHLQRKLSCSAHSALFHRFGLWTNFVVSVQFLR